MPELLCFECLQPADPALRARGGVVLCAQCAAAFYLTCIACSSLIPRGESTGSEAAIHCPECLVRTAAEPVSAAEIEELVAEYVRLHAEEKQISDRLEEIKGQLKAAADGQPRVAGAVVLRAGDQAVKCSYAARASYNAEKIVALEATVGTEMIETLFERKVSFSPIKESLKAFLADQDELHAATRAAVRAAEERKEVVTLTVVPPKQKK
jgi:hypothetical protein